VGVGTGVNVGVSVGVSVVGWGIGENGGWCGSVWRRLGMLTWSIEVIRSLPCACSAAPYMYVGVYI